MTRTRATADDVAMQPREYLDASERLSDERSRKVIFVSHCLLNENTRYIGGAFRPGAVTELVADVMRNGWGIYQMPCPEQRAWGGVLKRHLLHAYGAKAGVLYHVRRPLLRAFIAYTRLVYAHLARRVALDIADYQRSGFEVIGVVGVGASPSCGVATTLDMTRSLEVLASCPLALMDRKLINERAVVECRIAGDGLFVRALKQQLDHKGIELPFFEHDLVAEMRGERQTPFATLLGRDHGPRLRP